MIRPSRRWRSPEAVALAAALAALASSSPRRAHAQACCAGGTVVTPARLAPYEDWAVGLQMRARSNPGSFSSAGEYRTSAGVEQVFEQDLAASARLMRRAQLGVMVPMIQTHRNASGLDDWGGGIGDVSLTARYDALLPAQSLYWPGISVLVATTLPTGTPPDAATHPLAADATGEGTYDFSVGLDLEKAFGHVYVAVNGWLTHRFDRTVAVAGAAPISNSFSTRWTALAVASYVFDNDAALGLQVSNMNEGVATINGVADPTTGLRTTTVGLAGVIPLRDSWRVQGTLFSDVMLSSFGRNEPAGYGLTAAIVRVWM
jgi:hypothetical protein